MLTIARFFLLTRLFFICDYDYDNDYDDMIMMMMMMMIAILMIMIMTMMIDDDCYNNQVLKQFHNYNQLINFNFIIHNTKRKLCAGPKRRWLWCSPRSTHIPPVVSAVTHATSAT